jgi:hypothetical protein
MFLGANVEETWFCNKLSATDDGLCKISEVQAQI